METARQFEKWRRALGDANGDGLLSSADHKEKRKNLLREVLGMDHSAEKKTKATIRQEKQFRELGEATVLSFHCLFLCFSAFPCGSTALTEDRCDQSR
eukprot:SAG22_NODE_361_length_11712_cov_6.108155_4_plen_98_part_00